MKIKQQNDGRGGFMTPSRIIVIGMGLILTALAVSKYLRSPEASPESPARAQNVLTVKDESSPDEKSSRESKNVPGKIKVPSIIMETGFPTLDGGEQRITDYAGKIVVLDVWATWCGPCRVEIPHLIALREEFKSKGVEVIGLTTEDPETDRDKVEAFVKEFKISYPIGFARGEFARYLLQGQDIIPQTYVIGRDGNLVRRFIGFNAQTSAPQLRVAIEDAIAAK